METQERIFKIHNFEAKDFYNKLGINLEINIFGENNIIRKGIVSGILGFILDHYNSRKREIEKKYSNKKMGLNPVQQYILDRTMKIEIDEVYSEYSDTKEFCILFKKILKILNSISVSQSNLYDFLLLKQIFLEKYDDLHNVLNYYNSDLIELSNIDFITIEKIIDKMQSIFVKTKENIRFFVPSENKCTTFKDYMEQVIKVFKKVLVELKSKYELIGDTHIKLDEPIILEGLEMKKQII